MGFADHRTSFRSGKAEVPGIPPDLIAKSRVAVARRIQRTRCRANILFGSRIMSDPRYEMLLELYVAHHEEREVSVSDLALAADIPPTTGLRKLEKLEADGFVYRLPDRCDGRRWWVKPTAKVLSDFDMLLDQLGDALKTP